MTNEEIQEIRTNKETILSLILQIKRESEDYIKTHTSSKISELIHDLTNDTIWVMAGEGKIGSRLAKYAEIIELKNAISALSENSDLKIEELMAKVSELENALNWLSFSNDGKASLAIPAKATKDDIANSLDIDAYINPKLLKETLSDINMSSVIDIPKTAFTLNEISRNSYTHNTNGMYRAAYLNMNDMYLRDYDGALGTIANHTYNGNGDEMTHSNSIAVLRHGTYFIRFTLDYALSVGVYTPKFKIDLIARDRYSNSERALMSLERSYKLTQAKTTTTIYDSVSGIPHTVKQYAYSSRTTYNNVSELTNKEDIFVRVKILSGFIDKNRPPVSMPKIQINLNEFGLYTEPKYLNDLVYPCLLAIPR